MTVSSGGEGREISLHGGDDPATAMGDVWRALDALPRSVASPSDTASTIETVALSARRHVDGAVSTRAWLIAAGLVVTAFLGGAVVGRLTAPGIDPAVLEQIDRLKERLDQLDRRPRVPPRPFNEWERMPRRGPPPDREMPPPPH